MLKKFFSYYRPHKKLFIIDFSSAILMSILALIFPLVVRYVVDTVLPAGEISLLVMYSVALLVLYFIDFGLDYVVTYWGHVLGIRIEYDMRKQLFSHIQKLSFTYFDNNRTAHIMSRVVNDLNEIGELAHHGPEEAFIVTITVVGSFAILFTMNVKLALIILMFIPVMIWFTAKRNREMRAAFQDQRAKVADINAQVEDSISGIRLVKAFANEGHEREKFEVGNYNYFEARQNTHKAMARFFPGVHLLANLFKLTVLLGGGYYLYIGELTVGEFMSFFLYVGLFIQPVRQIGSLVESYQKGMSGFRRFIEVIELEPDIQDNPNAREVGKLKGDIRFEDVSFSYDDKKEVLKNLNLHIKEGEVVALVGPSGGGKTTLCSLIPRFYEVDSGRITIDGMDIRDMTQNSLRNNIGIVQQDVFLFSETARDNIMYGNVYASEKELVEASIKANAHDFISELEDGYDTLIGEKGVKLSGGQKQRLSIARVFLKDPSILILDEATSALDNETEQLIQKALFDLTRNRTTLIIAHRLATIRFVDRIIVLNDEGVAETGSHEELMKLNGIYANLYASQFVGKDFFN